VLARPLFPIRTAESRYESGANVYQSCLSLKEKLRPTQLAASVDEHHSHWAEMVPSASGAVLHASGKVQVMEPVAVILLCSRMISIQTAEDSVANIVVGGPSVLVEPSASVKFKGSAVELAGGSVSVLTS